MNNLKIKTYYLYLSVFITGAAVLVMEIAGTRVLAPFYGSTIYVWSSLISATLGFLALGYWLGGKLADKKPDLNILSLIMFLAGIFILLIPKFDAFILIKTDSFGPQYGPLAASIILFSIPILLLGMVSPMAVKIKTKELANLGITAGRLYALATVGSLIGALFTGFYLISKFTITGVINFSAFLLVGLFLVWKLICLIKK